MRRIRIAGIAAMAACSGLLAAPLVRGGEPALEQLAWIGGCWNSVDGEAGTGELWMPLAGGSLLGISRTVQRGKTAFHEFMRIERDAAGRITFFAQPRGAPQTAFQAIRVTDTEVVFENPAHDFPQRVGYRFEAPATLRAHIEGTSDGKPRREEFHYVRAACDAVR